MAGRAEQAYWRTGSSDKAEAYHFLASLSRRIEYNLLVRMVKRIITTLLALSAFLTFQVVGRPLMICLVGSCRMLVCPVPETEREQFCVTVLAEAQKSGCCAMDEAEEKTSPCGGCGKTEEAPAAIDFCGDFDSPDRPCFPPQDCDQRGDQCPGPFTACVPCLPIPVFSEPAVKLTARISIDQTCLLAAQATRALAEADIVRGFQHAHSPPCFVPARAGSQICIEKCSFLI